MVDQVQNISSSSPPKYEIYFFLYLDENYFREYMKSL